MPSRASLLCAALPLLAAGPHAAADPAPPAPPNIVFILADDLGYGDIGIFGNPLVETPNIDRMAARGTVLTQCYSAAPVCMPSRISIMTGKYDYRTGARMSVDNRRPHMDQPWLPGLLAQAGYASFIAGKLHIGVPPARLPEVGFDDWAICAPGGWSDFWEFPIHSPEGVRESVGLYSTDMITNETIRFIREHAGQPFLAFASYTAPHFPLQARDEDLERFAHLEDISEGARIVYAMVRRMDHGIGLILEALEEEGVLDNTLVVLTSDNGPELGGWQGIPQHRWNAELAGQKSNLHDGGIRVPGIIQWPASMADAAPASWPHLFHGVDWHPTLLGAAGVPVPADQGIDGEDLLPALLGREPHPDSPRFWSYNKARLTDQSNAVLREGPWKLHRGEIRELNQWGMPPDTPYPDEIPPYRLFRVDSDPSERNDLSGLFPERAQRMQRDFEAWFRDTKALHERLNDED